MSSAVLVQVKGLGLSFQVGDPVADVFLQGLD